MRTSAHTGPRRLLIAAAAIILLSSAAASAEPELPAPVRDAVSRGGYAAGEQAALSAEAERAVRAGIPAEDVAVIIARGSGDSGTVRRLLGTAAQVREQGLPVRPVLNRIQQGLAKGVPPDQVAAAAERLSGRLNESRPIVESVMGSGVAGGGRDRDYAMETVARALEKSIPREAIAEAGARVNERKGSLALFDKAVDTMSGLVENGMRPDAASKLVQDAVRRGSSEKDLSRLERDVSEGLRKERRQKEKDEGRRDRRDDRRDDRDNRGRDDRDRSGSGSGSGHGGRGR